MCGCGKNFNSQTSKNKLTNYYKEMSFQFPLKNSIIYYNYQLNQIRENLSADFLETASA